jgi:hypothetical protein
VEGLDCFLFDGVAGLLLEVNLFYFELFVELGLLFRGIHTPVVIYKY